MSSIGNKNGQIAAVIVDGAESEATLKRVYVDNGVVTLQGIIPILLYLFLPVFAFYHVFLKHILPYKRLKQATTGLGY